MKVVFALILAIAAVSALPVENTKGWNVPQEDGSFKWMSESEFEQLKLKSIIQGRAATKVHFYLYTNGNPETPEILNTNDVAGLKNTRFNAKYPTRFIVHGWQSNADNDLCYEVRDAFFSKGKFNVVCVDWSDKAGSLNYAASVLRVSGVGKQLAEMIDFLNEETGMPFENLLITGHSLGAHVCGYAGKYVENGVIQQITGLDPALPLFSYESPSSRLSDDDAEYVEIIHTNGGILGFLLPIGDADFYPNGGKSQPGCGIDLTGSCAHSRSYYYYAESTRDNGFPAMKCSSYEEAVGKICGSTYSSVKMGSMTNFINAGGEFYVPVNKKSPFGMSA